MAEEWWREEKPLRGAKTCPYCRGPVIEGLCMSVTCRRDQRELGMLRTIQELRALVLDLRLQLAAIRQESIHADTI